jgi:hypothetical protein
VCGTGYPGCFHNGSRHPGRFRAVPAALLRLELAAGIVASLTGMHPLLSAQPAAHASSATAGTADIVRRAATATLFALHTIRFAIYLSPDQGRRAPLAAAGPVGPGSARRQPR